MDYHDAEISIQDVNRLNAEIFWAGWMYVGAPTLKENPYFAPYFTQKTDTPGISQISRVMETQVVVLDNYPEVTAAGTPTQRDRWSKGLPMLLKRARKEDFADKETRLFFLDEPMTLIQPPLTKKAYNATSPPKRIGPSQIPKGFVLRFDELRQHAIKAGSSCHDLPGAR